MLSTGLSEVIGSWNTKPHDVSAGKENFPLGDASRWIRDQPQYRERANGLAGTAFTDDRHGFPGIDGVGNSVNSTHNSSTGSKFGAETLHFQEWWQNPSPTQPLQTSALFDVLFLIVS
jgi:hypothetical protein